MSKRFSTYIDILESGDTNDLKSSVKNDFTYMLKEFAAWKDKSQWEKKNAVEATGANPDSGLNQQPKADRVGAAEAPVPASFADKIAARNQRTRATKTDQALAQAQPQQQLGRQGTIDALQQRNDELVARNARASDAQVAGTDTTVQALKNDIHVKNPEYLQTELEPQNDPEVQAALGQNQQPPQQQQQQQQQEPPPAPPAEEPPPEQPAEQPVPQGQPAAPGRENILKRMLMVGPRAINKAVNFADHGNADNPEEGQNAPDAAGGAQAKDPQAPAPQAPAPQAPVAGLRKGGSQQPRQEKPVGWDLQLSPEVRAKWEKIRARDNKFMDPLGVQLGFINQSVEVDEEPINEGPKWDKVKQFGTQVADVAHKGMDAVGKGVGKVTEPLGKGIKGTAGWVNKFDNAVTNTQKALGGTNQVANVSGFASGKMQGGGGSANATAGMSPADFQNFVATYKVNPQAAMADPKFQQWLQSASDAEKLQFFSQVISQTP